jgi:hypothetical protein
VRQRDEHKRMRFFSSAGISICLVLFFSISCENNNELDLYGPSECDTIDLTWENTIKEILAENCVRCHGPDLSYNNVRHDSYETERIVVDDGRLRGVVNHLPGYTPMPFDRPKLPECDLKQINAWLDADAPEN